MSHDEQPDYNKQTPKEDWWRLADIPGPFHRRGKSTRVQRISIAPIVRDDDLTSSFLPMALSPSPKHYTTYVFTAGVSLAVIVFTGAAVRLTDAGLGCENWPACTDQRFTPEWELHGWIEFGNRLLSGVVAVAVCLAVLTAYRRIPKRPDLIRWAWGLVAGVAAQIVLGGITVRIDLHPAFVGAHYLLSMVLLWNVVVLWFRSVADGPTATAHVAAPTRRLGQLLVILATTVAVLGTVVTGTGPNGGDIDAERLPFDFRSVVQTHSVAVWVFLATLIALAILLFRDSQRLPTTETRPFHQDPRRLVGWLLAASLLQGLIGYVQYFRGVPPLLVELHIVGAVSVWVLTIGVYLSMFTRAEK